MELLCVLSGASQTLVVHSQVMVRRLSLAGKLPEARSGEQTALLPCHAGPLHFQHAPLRALPQ